MKKNIFIIIFSALIFNFSVTYSQCNCIKVVEDIYTPNIKEEAYKTEVKTFTSSTVIIKSDCSLYQDIKNKKAKILIYGKKISDSKITLLENDLLSIEICLNKTKSNLLKIENENNTCKFKFKTGYKFIHITIKSAEVNILYSNFIFITE